MNGATCEFRHPPDVTALIVTKETDVTRALRGSRERVVLNAHRITMEMIVVMILLFVIFGQQHDI